MGRCRLLAHADLRPHRGDRRGRRLWRPAGRRTAARGRLLRYPDHRGRRRLRRYLVLEPLSRGDVRYRGAHLPAAARGAQLRTPASLCLRAGDARAQPAHRRALRAPREGVFPDGHHVGPLARGRRAMARRDEPRRSHDVEVFRAGVRAAKPAQAARHPGHRPVRGACFPFQPLGLSLHRWRYDVRQPGRIARQARRGHRHRRHGRPDRARGRQVGRAARGLPAHAVLGRRPRPAGNAARLRRHVEARLAEGAAGKLPASHPEYPPGDRLRSRRLGRDLEHAEAGLVEGGCRSARPPADARGRRSPGRGRRLQGDEHAAVTGRRGRARLRDGRGAEALVSLVLQASLLP